MFSLTNPFSFEANPFSFASNYRLRVVRPALRLLVSALTSWGLL